MSGNANVDINTSKNGYAKYIVIAIMLSLIIIAATTLVGIASDARDESEDQLAEDLELSPELTVSPEETGTEVVSPEETGSVEVVNMVNYGMTTGVLEVPIIDARLSNVNFDSELDGVLRGTADVLLEPGPYRLGLFPNSPGVLSIGMMNVDNNKKGYINIDTSKVSYVQNNYPDEIMGLYIRE
ncbi:MAG: hypothetical protein KAS01_00755 [Candidatus Pacebacteria bacterium]|nr:hypothetical protein [Candidatus Paceibacterota bacterium]